MNGALMVAATHSNAAANQRMERALAAQGGVRALVRVITVKLTVMMGVGFGALDVLVPLPHP